MQLQRKSDREDLERMHSRKSWHIGINRGNKSFLAKCHKQGWSTLFLITLGVVAASVDYGKKIFNFVCVCVCVIESCDHFMCGCSNPFEIKMENLHEITFFFN